MMDREKVIKGLECCKNPSWEGCEDCPYYEHCEELAHDALALLKAQEPRILTPVEYKEWCVGNRKTPLLIERRRIHKKKHEMYWLNDPEGAVHVDEEYGKSFVVWTGWPSDVQQNAVHWREIDALKMEVGVPKIGVKTRHISEKYQSGGYDDWSGAQGNDGERIKEQAKRSEWGIYG